MDCILNSYFQDGKLYSCYGIDTQSLKQLTQSDGLFGFYNMISGGSLSRFSVFALGVVPYINSSIIMQLLTIAIPQLEQLSKEGEEGRKKIQNITRYLSLVIGVITAYGSYLLINRYGAIKTNSPMTVMLIIISLVVGSTFLMWLGDQITVKGVGNGVSIIIFANIIAGLPMTAYQLAGLTSAGSINVIEIVLFVVFTLGSIMCSNILIISREKSTSTLCW